MDWTGATNNPTLTVGGTLHIYGSLTFIPAMTSTYYGAVYFNSTNTGNTITLAGNNFSSQVLFDGAGGEWILQDAFTIYGSLALENGTLNTNNNALNCTYFYSNSFNNIKSLILGTSTVTVAQAWSISSSGNMFLDADASTINFIGINSSFSSNFTTGNQTYHNVNFSMGNQSISGNNIFNILTFAGNGTISGNNVANNATFGNDCNVSGTSNFQDVIVGRDGNFYDFETYHHLTVNRTATISGGNDIDKMICLGNCSFNGTNTFDSLILTPGKKYTFEYNKTQTINNYLSANASCSAWIWIRSSSPGSQATISKVSGNVDVQYVRLQDIKTSGGATFTAINSTDLGNNTDWAIAPPLISTANLYWVGGGGEWSDGTHWSFTSGGSGGACIPTPENNVFFDTNSFPAGSQSVFVDDISFCKSMNWTGATNSPLLTGAGDLNIYGSLVFISNMSSNFSGKVFFKSNIIGQTITSAGKTFLNYIYFDRTGGGWILQDAFATNSYLYLNRGSLNTNGRNLNCYYFHTANTNSRELILGSSVITVGYYWDLSIVSNITFDAGTSTINLTNYDALFSGGDRAYYNLNFLGGGYSNVSGNLVFNDLTFAGSGHIDGDNGGHNLTFGTSGSISGHAVFNDVIFSGSGIISGSNSIFHNVIGFTDLSLNGTNLNFNKLDIRGDGTIYGTNVIDSLLFSQGHSYLLQNGTSQSINNYLKAIGTCIAPIWIHSGSIGSQATINKSSGNINCSYLRLQDIRGFGGASYVAANSIDLGGNSSNWVFSAPAAQNLYWVGGSGNWNNASHWANSSGGAGGACLPTPYDDVHFDINSFSGPDNVNIDAISYCKSMDWTGATNSPKITGNSPLNIYGSLKLNATLNSTTYYGSVNFKSTGTGNTITTNGNSISNSVIFDGAGGEWTLQDAFIAPNSSISLNNGTLTTNNQNLSCYYMTSNISSNNRVINLGSSTATIGGSWVISYPYTNYTINAGTSTINFINDPNLGGYPILSAGDQTYYDVNILNTLSYQIIFNNGTFHNITFTGSGSVRGNNIASDVSFGRDGYIQDTDTFHDVNTVGDLTISSSNSKFHNVTIGGNLNKYNSSLCNFNRLNIAGNGTISGTNTIDTLQLSAGKTYAFEKGQTQTLISLIANGNCSSPITIGSTEIGTQAVFNSSSANITANNLRLRDINATGGATFTANNSINFGNNTGWDHIYQPSGINLYWVGGTGNWYDTAHWSFTSGGAGGACIPTLYDDVHFDANSFSIDLESVTISAIAYCRSMDWTSTLHSPAITG